MPTHAGFAKPGAVAGTGGAKRGTKRDLVGGAAGPRDVSPDSLPRNDNDDGEQGEEEGATPAAAAAVAAAPATPIAAPAPAPAPAGSADAADGLPDVAVEAQATAESDADSQRLASGEAAAAAAAAADADAEGGGTPPSPRAQQAEPAAPTARPAAGTTDASGEVPAAAAEDKGWDTAVAQARVLNLRADGTEIQELEEGWTDPVRTNSTSLFGGAVDNQEERL